MLDHTLYTIKNREDLPSPSLLYFYDIIKENTEKAIALAGDAKRLWPHIKSHKTRELIAMQLAMGITRFKCATIAEAQMVAQSGAPHIILAYPLVGPNIQRFLTLCATYPATRFYAIGDDESQLALLSAASAKGGFVTPTLLDVNLGMNRTGVSLEKAESLYRACAALPGLYMAGIHGYDGHRHEQDIGERKANAQPGIARIHAIRSALQRDGIPCELLVMGGTPSFPVHAEYAGHHLSPGTVFLTDWGYLHKAPDLPFLPGAAILSRVVSHPGTDRFTLDVGTKAIASEMQGPRGHLIGWEKATPVLHSEEHWVFQMPAGEKLPPIGETILVIPTHICPTNALYDQATVIREGKVFAHWAIAARTRSLGV